jgi:hypothetical protein
MKKLYEIEVDLPAKVVWVAACENFGETGQWTSFLDSSYLEGDVSGGGYRVCLQGRKKFTEHITKFDAENMLLEYELINGRPVIIESARNCWSVVPLGAERSKLIMSPIIVLKWWAKFLKPMLNLGLSGTLPKVLEEFKYWAETGDVHPRKKSKG